MLVALPEFLFPIGEVELIVNRLVEALIIRYFRPTTPAAGSVYAVPPVTSIVFVDIVPLELTEEKLSGIPDKYNGISM
jgi:hypothetical protein